MNSPIRILLVDDSPHFLQAARDFLLLQDSVHVIGAVQNSTEAVREARRLEPDVILLDLNLGAESGLDIIPLFRTHLPQTKIIVLTGLPAEPYCAAARQAGADAFIYKAEMSKTLIAQILEVANVSRAGREPPECV